LTADCLCQHYFGWYICGLLPLKSCLSNATVEFSHGFLLTLLTTSGGLSLMPLTFTISLTFCALCL
jgi:hypothetical protein